MAGGGDKYPVITDNGAVAYSPSDGHAPPAQIRWDLALRVAEAVLLRHAPNIRAIWVHGTLAHGEAAGSVDLTVLTGGSGGGPRPAVRRIDRVIVDLDVLTTDECLQSAVSLTASWPLTADRYVTGRALHDPDDWHGRLRDAHLGKLATADDDEFAAVARPAWGEASAARCHAAGLAEWHDTDAAMLALGTARLGAAVVEGLLTRTYFRGAADAVARTGMGVAGLGELAQSLERQAQRLARRGYPVDGSIDDLVTPAPR